MRLRLRLGSRTENVVIENDAVLGSLVELVAATFGLAADSFLVTLNGKDAIDGESTTSLGDLDIVSGDLIRIAVRNGEVPSAFRPNPESQLHPQQQRRDAQEERGNPSTTDGRPETMMCEDYSSGCREASGSRQSEVGTERVCEVDQPPVLVVSEPMLCRESTGNSVPYRLQRLFSEIQPSNANEAMCVVLNVLMLESGFSACVKTGSHANASTSCGSTEDCQDLLADEVPETMPDDWKMPGAYSLTYTHPTCEGTVCKVTCVPMGQVLVVHGTIQNSNGTKCQLTLKPADYVYLPLSQNAAQAYTQLPLLSRIFKDGITYCLLATMRRELGQPPLHGLLALMAEIQLRILSFLDLKSLVAMSAVCKDFYGLVNDNSLWRRLYLQNFGKYDTSQPNWKKLFVMRYKQRMQSRRRVLPPPPLIPHPQGIFPSFHPPIPPMYPPGVRGGDYDRDPFAINPQRPHLPRVPGPRIDPRVDPRFDPLNPLPDQPFIPGSGGGVRDSRGSSRVPNPRGFPNYGAGGRMGRFL